MKKSFASVGIVVLIVIAAACLSAQASKTDQAIFYEKGRAQFVVMGDNRPANIFRPEQPYIYLKAVQAAVALKPEAILNTGDLMLGYDALTAEKAKQEFDDFESASKPIRDAGIPLYIAMGNHAGYSEFARAEFTKRYKDPTTGKLYYSVDIGNCRAFILNTEQIDNEAQITGEQFDWLKNEMEASSGKHKFVLLHRPLYPKIKHLTNSLNKYPTLRDQLADLFRKHDVDMVFAGHVHVYNYTEVNGLKQIIAGGSGAPLAGDLAQGGFSHFFHVIVNDDDVDYRLLPLENEVLLAANLLQGDYYDGAVSLAKIAQDTVPGHPMPHIVAASAYQLGEKDKEFEFEFALLTRILGSEVEALFRLGEFDLSVNQLESADKFLHQALESAPDSFKIIYFLGQTKQAKKEYEDALNYLEQALRMTDDSYTIRDIEDRIAEIKYAM